VSDDGATELASATSTHCTGCGRTLEACPGCAGETDPPRYCAQCGTWLAVQVRPVGWTARCKVHGTITS
jgi:hypothetical protein